MSPYARALGAAVVLGALALPAGAPAASPRHHEAHGHRHGGVHHHRHRKPRRRPHVAPQSSKSAGLEELAPPRSSSPWLTPQVATYGPSSPPVTVTPSATITPTSLGEPWCDPLPPLRLAGLYVPRPCRRELLGALEVRWSAPGEGEIVVDAPVCGLGGCSQRWEGRDELTLYEYLWRAPAGEPRLGLVEDPRYLPRESASEAECTDPQPTPAQEAANDVPNGAECPTGAEWAQDLANAPPILAALASWSVFGTPLNG